MPIAMNHSASLLRRSATKRGAVSALLLATLAFSAHAGADAGANADAMSVLESCAIYTVDARKLNINAATTGDKDKCVKAVATLKASGAKGIHKDVGGYSFREFGGVVSDNGLDITLENLEKMCAQYQRYALKANNSQELLAIAAFLGTDIKDSQETAKIAVETADRCTKLVDEILAAGFPGSTPLVPASVAKTYDEVKPKVCDVQRAKGQALLKELEATEAPLRAALKEDKLMIALDRKQTQFYGVGMKPLVTPAQMAASKLWFIHSWSEEETCRSNGRAVHRLRRYAFNAKHVLADETNKDFCGAPPKSAYR
jgi:hypothetical protein